MPIQGTESLGGKVSQKHAGYMELSGAKKDSYCEVVEGRVSSQLGCSNLFDPEKGVQQFKCGTCTFLIPDGDDSD